MTAEQICCIIFYVSLYINMGILYKPYLIIERKIKMAKVIPFCGTRYNTEMFKDLNDVTAPPYDIISKEEQQCLYNKNEYNIIRIDYGMEFDSDTEENNRYTRGGESLRRWIEENVMIREDEPAFYVYEQVFSLSDGKPAHSLKGILSLVELRDFADRVVLPHEFTISKAKTDRLNLMRETGANTSPVYSLYLDDEETIARTIEENSEREPDISFTSAEGIKQHIWVIKDKDTVNKISGLFENKQIFIADGHHRYETALNYRNERHAADGTPVGSKDYDYIMMMLVSMSNSGLFVFPTHRLIRDVEGFDETMLVSLLTEQFAASKIYFTEGDYASIITERLANTVDEKLFALYTGKNYYYLLKLKDVASIDEVITDMSDAYKHLDVTILHTLILEKHLGIDEENMRSQKNLVYVREAADAVKAVQDGEYQCAFLINPTKLSEIREVALANEKMPQKSTYFWPKLITGLVVNKFED